MKRIAAGVLLLVVACGSDGRVLREPPPGASAPAVPRSTTATTAPPFTLGSSAFESGTAIPQRFTCDGANVSPPFAWGSVPAGTVELVLTITDPDANGFVHWVMAGISPSVQAVSEGAVPDDAVEAKNGKGTAGYTGPCPPPGSPHTYIVNLYALTTASGVTAGMTGAEAIRKIGSAAGVIATTTGTYQRA